MLTPTPKYISGILNRATEIVNVSPALKFFMLLSMIASVTVVTINLSKDEAKTKTQLSLVPALNEIPNYIPAANLKILEPSEESACDEEVGDIEANDSDEKSISIHEKNKIETPDENQVRTILLDSKRIPSNNVVIKRKSITKSQLEPISTLNEVQENKLISDASQAYTLPEKRAIVKHIPLVPHRKSSGVESLFVDNEPRKVKSGEDTKVAFNAHRKAGYVTSLPTDRMKDNYFRIDLPSDTVSYTHLTLPTIYSV